MTRREEAERQECIDKVRKLVTPGQTLYTILRSRSRSGMSRTLDVYALEGDSGRVAGATTVYLTGYVARVLECRMAKDQGLVVVGCGMDMGFHVVYSLARCLYPEGFGCVGAGCPSNDHSNGDRDYTPHMHKDGGYALPHRWL